jgi:hypothetical protein
VAACREVGSARRQACPAYAVITAVAQVGWVTLLLIARQCLSWPAGVPFNLGRPSTRSERGFGRDLAYFPNLPSRSQFRAVSTRSKSALLHRPRRDRNSERVC